MIHVATSMADINSSINSICYKFPREKTKRDALWGLCLTHMLTLFLQTNPLVINFTENSKRKGCPLRFVSTSLSKTNSSIDPIGEKLHKNYFQERCPLTDVSISLDDIYYFIDLIGEKLHRIKLMKDALWGMHLTPCPTFVYQFTPLVIIFKKNQEGCPLRAIATSLDDIDS